MIQQLNLKLGISLSKLQLLLKLFAEQAFNTTSSIPDKLRMLFIHIRTPCKLFYQVSLNFNIQDTSSEEIEVDQLDYDKIKTIKSGKDILSQETSQKAIRKRYLSTSPDSITCLQEKSPKNVYIPIETRKYSDSNKITFGSKTMKEKLKSTGSDREINKKTKEIRNKFDKFKNKHLDLISSESICGTSKKLKDRKEYACNLRNKMFSSVFVKQMIFTAWKGVCSRIV